MARKLQHRINSVKQSGTLALNDAPPAPLASAWFSDQTLRAFEENAQRARAMPPRPMSKDDFDRLLG
ncbi:hypothetical protein [Massilia sp. CCM 8734]|uniref:hypothetical protein n=1 Tax=Massilia sp. CCM 8734 TaxID=2609283 RepID=UPI001420F7AC|nr:hypothetical protein [Massilia sp. CCM 8734]NHZ99988.1 hypothetical protein [Massilia sp. CCM 8734]